MIDNKRLYEYDLFNKGKGYTIITTFCPICKMILYILATYDGYCHPIQNMLMEMINATKNIV